MKTKSLRMVLWSSGLVSALALAGGTAPLHAATTDSVLAATATRDANGNPVALPYFWQSENDGLITAPATVSTGERNVGRGFACELGPYPGLGSLLALRALD